VDFIGEFAGPLPVDVIADQLGLPRADGLRIRQWTDAIIETLDVMITAERRLACTQRIVEFQRYFVARREEKRAQPREDILSALAVARQPDGTELSTEDYVALCAQLMVAGNDTTRNHLTKGMYLLTQDPKLQARLRREPALIPRFVEESLRVEAPVQGLFRTCREDVVLGGIAIPKGAKVVLLYGAANRDPSAFPDPGRIDLDRPNAQRHLSFGHGVHSCIGRVLATAELTLSFRRLLERLDNIRLDPDFPAPRHRPHFSLRGLDSLNLAFDTAMPAR